MLVFRCIPRIRSSLVPLFCEHHLAVFCRISKEFSQQIMMNGVCSYADDETMKYDTQSYTSNTNILDVLVDFAGGLIVAMMRHRTGYLIPFFLGLVHLTLFL